MWRCVPKSRKRSFSAANNQARPALCSLWHLGAENGHCALVGLSNQAAPSDGGLATPATFFTENTGAPLARSARFPLPSRGGGASELCGEVFTAAVRRRYFLGWLLGYLALGDVLGRCLDASHGG